MKDSAAPLSLIRPVLMSLGSLLLNGFIMTQGLDFRSLYQNFGATVPGVLQFLLDHFWLTCATLIVCTVVQFGLLARLATTRSEAARGQHTLVSIGNMVIDGIIIVQLYIPIFQLGNVV